MPTLEVGGSKQNSLPSRLQANAVLLDASKLPNPYTTIDKGILERKPRAIIDWMLAKDTRSKAVLHELTRLGVEELAQGRDVRVQCYGGKDRSQAVACWILDSVGCEIRANVTVSCLDAEPMAELQLYK